jgi:hypothetical protein
MRKTGQPDQQQIIENLELALAGLRNLRRAAPTSRPSEPSGSGDSLVPDVQVRNEFGISPMTLWRWERDAALDFPKRVKIRGRAYRSRKQLDEFRDRMMNAAITQRIRLEQ